MDIIKRYWWVGAIAVILFVVFRRGKSSSLKKEPVAVPGREMPGGGFTRGGVTGLDTGSPLYKTGSVN